MTTCSAVSRGPLSAAELLGHRLGVVQTLAHGEAVAEDRPCTGRRWAGPAALAVPGAGAPQAASSAPPPVAVCEAGAPPEVRRASRGRERSIRYRASQSPPSPCVVPVAGGPGPARVRQAPPAAPATVAPVAVSHKSRRRGDARSRLPAPQSRRSGHRCSRPAITGPLCARRPSGPAFQGGDVVVQGHRAGVLRLQQPVQQAPAQARPPPPRAPGSAARLVSSQGSACRS